MFIFLKKFDKDTLKLEYFHPNCLQKGKTWFSNFLLKFPFQILFQTLFHRQYLCRWCYQFQLFLQSLKFQIRLKSLKFQSYLQSLKSQLLLQSLKFQLHLQIKNFSFIYRVNVSALSTEFKVKASSTEVKVFYFYLQRFKCFNFIYSVLSLSFIYKV